jgi:NitT/TauT family transport system permease protein
MAGNERTDRRFDVAAVTETAIALVVTTTALLVLWQASSLYVANPRILPAPTAVFDRMVEYALHGDLNRRAAPYHIAKTVVRVGVSSVLTLILGVSIGVLTATSERLGEAIIPWVPFWMTVPTVVVVLVTMILFDFSAVAVYASAVVVATPFAVTNVWEGVRDLDPSLLEMAVAFDAGRVLVWRDVYLPHLLPYVFSSYRQVLGIVWKIVIIGEVFGLETGIGSMFNFYYIIGEVDSMLAYVGYFICVLFVLEYVVLAAVERRCFRWRTDARAS